MDDIVYDIGSEPTGTVATSGRPDTRARILDAARDLILEQHPAALTIAEIAAAASRVTGIPAKRVLVVIQNSPAHLAIEGGRALPDPGEEEAWLREQKDGD